MILPEITICFIHVSISEYPPLTRPAFIPKLYKLPVKIRQFTVFWESRYGKVFKCNVINIFACKQSHECLNKIQKRLTVTTQVMHEKNYPGGR